MKRFCVCGRAIPGTKKTWRLCPECAGQYGTKSAAWPEWLRAWMGNYQAEIDQERRHLEGSINDEYFDPNACGTKTKPQHNQFERERDDNGGGDYLDPLQANTLNDDTMALLYPGSYFDNSDYTRSVYENNALEGLAPEDQSARTWGDGARDISPNMSEPGERDHVENLIHLHSLIDELPTESRAIVLLYIEGYNQAETAAKLGISQPKVSRLLAAAIEIMRKASA